MKRGGAGKRRDANEPDIVDALKGLGCRVKYVSGDGLPDLLVRKPGPSRIWIPLEVKTRTGKKTESQADADWALVRTPDEAIAAVFGG